MGKNMWGGFCRLSSASEGTKGSGPYVSILMRSTKVVPASGQIRNKASTILIPVLVGHFSS